MQKSNSDDANKVRKPDVAFVSFERLPPGRLPKGFATIPPDLAVEVLSPNDLASEVLVKVDEYLRANVRLVWVVDPESQTVLVNRIDGSGQRFRLGDELDGEDVLPGFRCRVSEIFAMPTV